MVIDEFIKHKTADWSGVVFTSKGVKYVANTAGFIWKYTTARQDKTTVIPASNETILAILRSMEPRADALSLSGVVPHELLNALRSMLKEGGYHASVASSC